ncbi:hypothetical protein JW823_08465 [bacterium]|nr:hypothetical protein [candidate division CSSED10-310 bacterium]
MHRILFDDLHGQSFGNADWTIDHAYSDFAEDIEKYLDSSVFAASQCGCPVLTNDTLSNMDCLVIPEPNIRFTSGEIEAIRNFLLDGGALFAIADHGGSDRNFDGWDSGMIFNEILGDFGLSFMGDTFTETPIRGVVPTESTKNSPCFRQIMKDVRQVAAWAATSIMIDSDADNWQILLNSNDSGLPFFVCGSAGAGRVAAIGDSSAFDDGSGDETKNRHSAYHSWLFDQQRLGIQTVAWLTRNIISPIPDRDRPFPTRLHDKPALSDQTRIIIDAARGNNEAGIMDRFGNECHSVLNCPVLLNFSDYSELFDRDILILSNPDIDLSEDDIRSLSEWINLTGGRLILCGTSIRHPDSNHDMLNRILTGIHSTIRFQPDQVVDETSNTGSAWSLIITDFPDIPLFSNVDKAVFWSSASLADQSGSRPSDSSCIRVLASSSNQSKSRHYEILNKKSGFRSTGVFSEKSGFVVAVAEKIGNGCIIILGANTFTNFQYPLDSDYQNMEPIKRDHRTGLFNLSMIRFLELSSMRKGQS